LSILLHHQGRNRTNQLKDAKLETGLTTRVRGSLSSAEKIKVSTENGEYLSRS